MLVLVVRYHSREEEEQENEWNSQKAYYTFTFSIKEKQDASHSGLSRFCCWCVCLCALAPGLALASTKRSTKRSTWRISLWSVRKWSRKTSRIHRKRTILLLFSIQEKQDSALWPLIPVRVGFVAGVYVCVLWPAPRRAS